VDDKPGEEKGGDRRTFPLAAAKDVSPPLLGLDYKKEKGRKPMIWQ